MLKIGLVGAGHLGKIHLKLIQDLPIWTLKGFHDIDEKAIQSVIQKWDIPHYEDLDKLIEEVDALSIVTPTLHHFEIAQKAIKAGKHVFIEKPLTHTLPEAQQLIELAKKHQVIGQVGHVERFNPAYLAVKEQINTPLFIETHRLAQFNPRGTDVSVVLDLMIHDLDIILKSVNANIEEVQASGVALISKQPDIANARLTFDNGCVANVTASRLSLKNMRKMRLFQQEAYLSIDFLKKQAEVTKLSKQKNEAMPSFELNIGENQEKKYISFEVPAIPTVNAIQKELECFAESILNGTTVEVSLEDGYKALELAQRISKQVQQNLERNQVHLVK